MALSLALLPSLQRVVRWRGDSKCSLLVGSIGTWGQEGGGASPDVINAIIVLQGRIVKPAE